MGKVRVLVADDSLTVRKRLIDILLGDPDFEVVAEAADGQEAIDLCHKHRPDVVTLDMAMPEKSGLAAAEHIMAHLPTPILIVSSSFNRGELFETYDALAAGAVDVLEKPSGGESAADWETRFCSSVKLVSRIKVVTHARRGGRGIAPPAPEILEPPGTGAIRLVTIGASTGGPKAVSELLRGLPPTFGVPILLVLHLADKFGEYFTEWLDGLSPLPVRLARDGERIPEIGTAAVIVAPPDRHLSVRSGRLWLADDPPRHSCRPSVDILFESLAVELGNQAVACLLTGMGRDGAAGMLALRRAGALTIAQDEASCIVFGMPREAILCGGAERVLPLTGIAPALIRRVGGLS